MSGVPANTVPPHFAGAVLRPDPAVSRPLTAYTRTRPDPVAEAFLEILASRALLMPAHVRRRLRLAGHKHSTGPDEAEHP